MAGVNWYSSVDVRSEEVEDARYHMLPRTVHPGMSHLFIMGELGTKVYNRALHSLKRAMLVVFGNGGD